MGHKVNPTGLRIGITTTWKSRWFSDKDYIKKLKEDVQIRDFVMKKWKAAAIADVEIERNANTIRLIIKTSRPGVLIGRGGT
jgi:small subunit ribosomal protein S3